MIRTIVVGVNLRDAEGWAADHGIDNPLTVSPRSSDRVRGYMADRIVWTKRADEWRQELERWQRLTWDIAPCLSRPDGE